MFCPDWTQTRHQIGVFSITQIDERVLTLQGDPTRLPITYQMWIDDATASGKVMVISTDTKGVSTSVGFDNADLALRFFVQLFSNR